jgi:hypothetical protein
VRAAAGRPEVHGDGRLTWQDPDRPTEHRTVITDSVTADAGHP